MFNFCWVFTKCPVPCYATYTLLKISQQNRDKTWAVWLPNSHTSKPPSFYNAITIYQLKIMGDEAKRKFNRKFSVVQGQWPGPQFIVIRWVSYIVWLGSTCKAQWFLCQSSSTPLSHFIFYIALSLTNTYNYFISRLSLAPPH